MFYNSAVGISANRFTPPKKMSKRMHPVRAVTSVLLSALFAAGGHGFDSVHHRHDDAAHPHHQRGVHHGHGRHGAAGHRQVAPFAEWARWSSAHAHYTWLGLPLPFSVPLENDSSDPVDAMPNLATARSGEGASFVVWSGSVGPPRPPGDMAAPNVADQPSSISFAQMSAIPLCARATHERSGVQLA